MAQVMSAGWTNKRPVSTLVLFRQRAHGDPPHKNINFSFGGNEQNSELLISEYKKGKLGKVHPITYHEGAEGKQSYSSTLSLTSSLYDIWV
jgi:hypothetical protein